MNPETKVWLGLGILYLVCIFFTILIVKKENNHD